MKHGSVAQVAAVDLRSDTIGGPSMDGTGSGLGGGGVAASGRGMGSRGGGGRRMGSDIDHGDDTHRRIAFTCGHSFKLREFNETIIPRFERRMERLGLGTSARLMVVDYSLQRSSLACPGCVIHAVKSEVVRVKRHSITSAAHAARVRARYLRDGYTPDSSRAAGFALGRQSSMRDVGGSGSQGNSATTSHGGSSQHSSVGDGSSTASGSGSAGGSGSRRGTSSAAGSATTR